VEEVHTIPNASATAFAASVAGHTRVPGRRLEVVGQATAWLLAPQSGYSNLADRLGVAPAIVCSSSWYRMFLWRRLGMSITAGASPRPAGPAGGAKMAAPRRRIVTSTDVTCVDAGQLGIGDQSGVEVQPLRVLAGDAVPEVDELEEHHPGWSARVRLASA